MSPFSLISVDRSQRRRTLWKATALACNIAPGGLVVLHWLWF